MKMNLKADSHLAKRSKKLIVENKNILIAAAASALLMVLAYVFFSVVPFGDKTVLRMDLYHQYAPFLAELYERVIGGDSLIYSWTSGLGNSMIGNYFNYLSSPFNILIFFFGHENTTEAISLIILLKCALASGTFAYFLKKSTGKDDLTISAFGVLYSFCSFFIAYYWNIMWTDALYLLPLVALGIEWLIRDKKWMLYCVSLAAAIITNYYMAFMMCAFSVIYFLYFFFISNSANAKYINLEAKQEKGQSFLFKLKNSKFLTSGARFAVFSVAAAGIAAFALIPTYFALKQCSATSGTFPESFKTYFTIFDFAANHLAGIDPSIRSSGGNVLPNVYCGMLTIILLPLFLFAKSISKREKIITCSIIIFFFFSFNTNYLNYIWHGFHFPNDLPYRFSYMYSFFLLIFAYKVLIRINEFSKNMILTSGLAVAAFTVIAQKVESKNLTELAVYITIALVAVYVVILLMMRDKKYQAGAMATLLLLCSVAEVTAADISNFSMSQSKKNYAYDYSQFEPFKEKLDNKENGEFYRMELAHLRTRNDPSWYYYNGVSTFSSLAYEKLSNLQKNIGMFGNYINSYTYNPQTPVYNAMFSLKYVVNNSTSYNFTNDYYKKSVAHGKFKAYENKYCLPLGFAVNDEVLNWDTELFNPFEVQNDFFALSTGRENVFTPVPFVYADYNNIEEFDTLDSNFFSFSTQDKSVGGSVTFTIDNSEASHLYAYVTSKTVKDITAFGSEINLSQDISKPYILDMGTFKAGEQAHIVLDIPESKKDGSFEIYVYKINDDVFREGYGYLESGKMDITEFKDTHIKGTFTAKTSQILYTSIPYDQSWKVMVDGKEVGEEDIVKIGDSLLGVKVSAGTHSVEFKFSPKGAAAGAVISVISLTAVILLICFKKPLNKLLEPVAVTIQIDEDNEFSDIEDSENDEPEKDSKNL